MSTRTPRTRGHAAEQLRPARFSCCPAPGAAGLPAAANFETAARERLILQGAGGEPLPSHDRCRQACGRHAAVMPGPPPPSQKTMRTLLVSGTYCTVIALRLTTVSSAFLSTTVRCCRTQRGPWALIASLPVEAPASKVSKHALRCAGLHGLQTRASRQRATCAGLPQRPTCTPPSGPSGTTRRPPGASCSTSSSGSRGAAAPTWMASYGAPAGHPLRPSPSTSSSLPAEGGGARGGASRVMFERISPTRER